MQKKFNVYAIVNAIVDVLIQVNDDKFSELDIEKGSYGIVSSEEQSGLLDKLSGVDYSLMSGGSVANSIIAFASLGGSSAVTAGVGSDEYGEHYKKEIEELEINSAIVDIDGATGTCVSVITSDAERTMRTDLGVASLISEEHLSSDILKESSYLFLEGYTLSSEKSKNLVRLAIQESKKVDGQKIAFTPSAKFIIENFSDVTKEVLKVCDLLFCNSEEAEAITGILDPVMASRALAKSIEHVVVTDGGNGVHIHFAGEEHHVPAFECSPVDMTGAGDIFAGSYLYGIVQGYSPEESAKSANFIASKLVEQVGARLEQDIKALWQEQLS